MCSKSKLYELCLKIYITRQEGGVECSNSMQELPSSNPERGGKKLRLFLSVTMISDDQA